VTKLPQNHITVSVNHSQLPLFNSSSDLRNASVAIMWTYFLPTISLATLYCIISTLRLAYRSDLSPLPGPKWAQYTGLYRVYQLWSRQAPSVYLQLHEKYGPIVRTGPNTVSIADPSTIPTIYEISSNFVKAIIFNGIFLQI
jgi:hypothetical protein